MSVSVAGAEPRTQARPAAELWVPGKPFPKERPRLARGRKAYTPKRTHDEEARIAKAYRNADLPVFDAPIFVDIAYSPEGQLIRIFDADWRSPLRGDIDNYEKLTLDALGLKDKGGRATAVTNDRLVVATAARKLPTGWLA